MNFKLVGTQFKGKLFRTDLAVLLVLFTICPYCIGSDTQREQYYANELSKSVEEDEVIWLTINRERFLSLYRETDTTEMKGAIILLHDLGQHPDHHPLLHSLRTELPRHQWSTLSLQMPLREQGAKLSDYEPLLPEAVQRIDSAITFLEKKKIKFLAIVGFGLGGVMASHYVAKSKLNNLQALVVAFLVKSEKKNTFPAVDQYFQKLKIPVLDIVCCEKNLSRSIKRRKIAAKENIKYQQLYLMQSRRDYRESYQGLLVQRVYGWLNRVLSPKR